MRQIPLALVPAARPALDNFLPGTNAALLAHLVSLLPQARAAAAGVALPAPVYLWGPVASGKTHLLRALAGAWQAAGAGVGWFEAGSALPWVYNPEWTVVLLDRCEDLSPAQQHAAFTLFVEAHTHGALWVSAGRLPPVDLPLREDLRTRLAWGHVYALQPLSEAETRAALRQEADRRGIFLPDEVMDHLLTHHPRDLGHLGRVLDALDHYGLALGRRITVPLLRQMQLDGALADVPSPPEAAA